MKKVLHIIGNMEDGGAQRVVLDYIERKDEIKKYDLEFLSLSAPANSKYDIYIKNNNIKFAYLKYKRSNIRLSYLRKFMNWMRRNVALWYFIKSMRVNVIHIHTTDILLEMLVILFLFNGKKFHTMHSDPYRFSNISVLLAKSIFKYLNVHPIAVSSGQRQRAMMRYGLSRCDLLRNSIDIEGINKQVRGVTRDSLRKKYNLPEHGFIIGSVGRLHQVKNYDGLIKVFSEYKKSKRIPVYLAIVGEGNERKNLINIVESLNLNDSVFFIGNLEQYEVYEFYKMIDLFMLLSHSESSSIVTLEAQAVGVRCLLADSIPADVVYRSNVRRMSLSSNISEWCKAIDEENYMNDMIYNNEDNDLNTVMLRLEKIYDKYLYD